MATGTRPLAIVTGASAGIGYELAKECARNGFDLLVAADQPKIHEAAQEFRTLGAQVEAVEADLATLEGVDKLYAAAKGRAVGALLANAGHGLGHGFLDQDFKDVRHVIDTNVTGTIYLIQKVGRDMRARGEGRILITGSIAGFTPGTYQAVYNATKAFIDSFSFALRHEVKDQGITVTCLMPGATETEFFERADMMDTKVGQSKKDDPADVAKTGFEAMMRGDGDVVSGWMNKLQTAIASVTPAGILAERRNGGRAGLGHKLKLVRLGAAGFQPAEIAGLFGRRPGAGLSTGQIHGVPEAASRPDRENEPWRTSARLGSHGGRRARRRARRHGGSGRRRPHQADQGGQRLARRPPPLHRRRARRRRRGRSGAPVGERRGRGAAGGGTGGDALGPPAVAPDGSGRIPKLVRSVRGRADL